MTVYVPEGEGAFTEEERSRQPTVFSALREIVAAFGCDDPHLGLYGAFGYDLAFQFEPVTLKQDRSDGQRDLVLHLPDEIYVVDLRREEAVKYSYEFTVGGAGTAGLARETADTPELKQRGPFGRPILSFPSPAGTPRSSSGRRRGSAAATSSRSCRAICSTRGARRRPRSTSGCGGGTRPRSSSCSTWPGGRARGVPGRRVARDVRAGAGGPGGDLPDLRHDRPRRRPAGGRGQHRHAARLGQGRVRADHVHRRGPQRQVAGLRPRHGHGDRAAADRDVQPPHPHRRSHRRAAQARVRRHRRVPHPHVGGHRDRRAEGLGDAVHRGQRDRASAAGTAGRSARSASTAP